ncbi:hypothetical protein [Paraburkholderia aromaticivorans]|uniref:hypothetical protein n=1 Tax=Paraburkholderia aromaticivorans TaxID=2026199 RepID=UPI003D672018
MTGAAAMDLHYTLWLFAVSLGASALGGMLGMASGIFIVPVLTMFGHVDIHVAIGAKIPAMDTALRRVPVIRHRPECRS